MKEELLLAGLVFFFGSGSLVVLYCRHTVMNRTAKEEWQFAIKMAIACGIVGIILWIISAILALS